MCQKDVTERTSFGDFLKEAVFQRLEQLGLEFQETEEYKAVCEKAEENFQRLLDALPEEQKKLLREYDNNQMDILADAQEFVYKAGFRDAFRFMYGLLGDKKDIRLDVRVT